MKPHAVLLSCLFCVHATVKPQYSFMGLKFTVLFIMQVNVIKTRSSLLFNMPFSKYITSFSVRATFMSARIKFRESRQSVDKVPT